MAIWGGLMHRCSTDEAPQHQYCPAGANSWCKWQQVQAGTRPSYEHKPAISKAVFDVLKPIYVKLSERQLLERCLMGATQNSNESFNAIVWSMCPKEGFCGVEVVQIATGLAVCTFNFEAVSMPEILHEYACVRGVLTSTAAEREDVQRVRKADRKASPAEKESRKKRRRHRKGWEEATIEAKGPEYEAGAF